MRGSEISAVTPARLSAVAKFDRKAGREKWLKLLAEVGLEGLT